MIGMYAKILFLLALAAINIIIWRDRKHIERGGVIFARRTKVGLHLLDHVAKIPVWNAIYTFAILVCVLGVLLIFLLIGLNAIYILITPTAPPGIAPVLPGVRIPGSPVFVPFWYGIFALGVLMLVHEFSHGIAARAQNMKVKSTGLLLALVIPGAFVEPDQKEFEKSKKIARMRVAAAGSFANFLTALLCVSVIVLMLQNFATPRGVVVFGVVKDTPAAEKFKEVTVITSINNKSIESFTDIAEAIEKVKPNETIYIKSRSLANQYTAIEEQIPLTTAAHPENSSKAFLGVRSDGVARLHAAPLLYALPIQPLAIVQTVSPKFFEYSGPKIFWQFLFTLKWIAFLNFAIGLVNLMPIGGLDGGLITKDILETISPRFGQSGFKIISFLILFFLLMNLLPYFR